MERRCSACSYLPAGVGLEAGRGLHVGQKIRKAPDSPITTVGTYKRCLQSLGTEPNYGSSLGLQLERPPDTPLMLCFTSLVLSCTTQELEPVLPCVLFLVQTAIAPLHRTAEAPGTMPTKEHFQLNGTTPVPYPYGHVTAELSVLPCSIDYAVPLGLN